MTDDFSKPAGRTIGSMLEQLGERTANCPEHGPYATTGRKLLGRETWTPCPQCENNRLQAELMDRERQANAALQQALEKAIDAAAIPARFRDRTFATFVSDTPERAEVLETVQSYADNFGRALETGRGLILSGPQGTGKTHLAAATLLQLAPRHRVMYMTASQLIRAVRDTWRRDSERSEREMLRMLGDELDLLVLDEVGVQYGSDGEKVVLFDVLDRRYANRRPTVLASNLHSAELKEALGERLYDRFRETQRMVPFSGDSARPMARVL